MYLRLVDYILRITTAPVHDSVSIAPWANCLPGCISGHASSPADSYWRVSMFLWLPSSLVMPLERDSHYILCFSFMMVDNKFDIVSLPLFHAPHGSCLSWQ